MAASWSAPRGWSCTVTPRCQSLVCSTRAAVGGRAAATARHYMSSSSDRPLASSSGDVSTSENRVA